MNLLFEQFESLTDAPKGIQKLRELILQLAVQGKLVEHDPNDEPANVLLERIQAEKEKLINEGKIKKEKPLSQISEEEISFRSPEGWIWSRLGDCSLINMGQSPPSQFYNDKKDGLPFYQGKTEFGELYPTPRKWCSSPKKIANPQEILISVRAPVGPTNLCPSISCIGRGLSAISTLNIYNEYYLLYYIRSIEKEIAQKGVGSTFTAISKSHLSNLIISLPPLNEQKRIVAKVDQLMELCDELEKEKEKRDQKRIHVNNASLDKLLTATKAPAEFQTHWQRIADHFDMIYDVPENVAELKKAILQLAVMGKLTPQDPNDEPAGELLKRIKKEKAKLIREGKIRKEKLLPPISEEEIPYELPEGWVWCRLGEIQHFINGYAFKSSDYEDSGIGIIRIGDIVEGKIVKSRMKFISPEKIKDLDESLFVNKNDLLIAMSGATTGKLGFNQTDEQFLLNQRVGKLNLIIVNKYYSYYYLKTKIKENLEKSSGSAIPNLSTRQINYLLFPLPSIQEQKRIVAKVDQLMALCDELEAQLEQSKQGSERLMGAVVNI